MNLIKRAGKFPAAALAVFVSLAAVTGCGGKKTEEAKAPVKTDLILAKEADAISIDPHVTYDGHSQIVQRQLYNQLLKLDYNMNIAGDLAESWNYLSDTEIRFILRKGVKFHNGEELKAGDVKASIERAKKSTRVTQFTATITEIKVIDDYTVNIVTSRPYAPLLTNLCHMGNSILSEKAINELGDKFGDAPVGTGPFKFVEWVSGDRIVLARNDGYFGGQVLPSSLTFRIIPEGAARTIALETGEVDMVLLVDAVDAQRVEDNPDLRLVETLSPKIEYFAFNQKAGPLGNKLVRQAINHAINRQAIFDVIAEGRGKLNNSGMNSKIMGYNPNIRGYAYDPVKARELLAQAGYPKGFDTVISVSGDQRNRSAQIFQAFLKDVGVNAAIENIEWSSFLAKVNRGDYEILTMSYNNTTGDPDTSLYQLFNSAVPASAGNRSFVNVPKVDELLNAGRVELDISKRLFLYQELQEILADEAVWVPLFDIAGLFGLRAGLQGFEPHPLGSDIFNKIHY
jgi:peptide/nickel transport system substrate-binding protein